MDITLCDLQGFAKAYMDDIVVYSESWEAHLTHVSACTPEGSRIDGKA